MPTKRPYHYIELWKRKAIIECALNKNKSIKRCAKELGVKYITAKHIVKLYKTTGRIETKCSNKGVNKKDTRTKASISEAESPTLKGLNNCFNTFSSRSTIESNYANPEANGEELQCQKSPNY